MSDVKLSSAPRCGFEVLINGSVVASAEGKGARFLPLMKEMALKCSDVCDEAGREIEIHTWMRKS